MGKHTRFVIARNQRFVENTRVVCLEIELRGEGWDFQFEFSYDHMISS
jgi:hypothetical protein